MQRHRSFQVVRPVAHPVGGYSVGTAHLTTPLGHRRYIAPGSPGLASPGAGGSDESELLGTRHRERGAQGGWGAARDTPRIGTRAFFLVIHERDVRIPGRSRPAARQMDTRSIE